MKKVKFGMAILSMVTGLAMSSASFAQSSQTLSAQTGAKTVAESNGDRLINLLDVEKGLDSIFIPLVPLFSGNVIAALERDPATADAIRIKLGNVDGRRRLAKLLEEEFLTGMRARYPEIKVAAVKEYRSRFSESELGILADFFETGAGAKWIEQQPALQASLSKAGEAIGAEVGSRAVMLALQRAESEESQ